MSSRMKNSRHSQSRAVSMRPRLRALLVPVLGLALSACAAATARSPAPEDQIDAARPYGVGGATYRLWGDDVRPDEVEPIMSNWVKIKQRSDAKEIAAGETIEEISLALSGGGPDGAFGAGLLKGWTARGDRPEFSIVTGVSTGAIVALFAFLGPDYDDELTEVYTTYSTDDLISSSIFSGLTGGLSFTDVRGYRALIEKYVDDEVVRRLAEEHENGRVLLIGTTNLDASRPVMWGLTKIAASGDPNAKRLIQDVIQASSAIPGAFPPIMIPVETADGQMFDEMHVDGGATQQVMLVSPEISVKEIDKRLGVTFDRTLYVVMNNKLVKPYEPTELTALDIAGKAVSSLISGSGNGDIYKIFAIAQRDDIALNVISIPRDFDHHPSEPFDPEYMKALFELGFEIGKAGGPWLPHPIDYAPAK